MTIPDLTIQQLVPARIESPLLDYQRRQGWRFNFIPDSSRVRTSLLTDVVPDQPDRTFEQAGPRRTIFFDPAQTRAAIVTCGGLCPGLNDVIRALVMELHYWYGVHEVYGVRYGYAGLSPGRRARHGF